MSKKALLIFIALMFCGYSALAAETANISKFQLSFWDRLTVPPDIDTITGLRLNFPYGSIQNVYGMDLGCVQDVRGDMSGVQISPLINFTGHICGVQIGAANFVREQDGVQFAGLFNHSDTARGFQIALFNFADELDGYQIGLLNISKERTMPIFNWGEVSR